MAARGSQLERVTQFFRDSSLDVARVTFQLVEEIMTERMEAYEKQAKGQDKAARTPRKPRKPRTDAASTAVKEGENLASA